MFLVFRPLAVRLAEYLALSSVVLWTLFNIWSDMASRNHHGMPFAATATLVGFITAAILCATRLKSDVALGMIMPFLLVLLLVAKSRSFFPEMAFFDYPQEAAAMGMYYLRLANRALIFSALLGAVASVLMWTPSARTWRKDSAVRYRGE